MSRITELQLSADSNNFTEWRGTSDIGKPEPINSLDTQRLKRRPKLPVVLSIKAATCMILALDRSPIQTRLIKLFGYMAPGVGLIARLGRPQAETSPSWD